MKPYLLRLGCGRFYVEFKDEERRALMAAIRERFGRPEMEAFPGASIWRFGGAAFTFYDPLGEPCLISDSEHGDDILQLLLEDIDPGAAKSADPVQPVQNLRL